jgi:hypothetical protein
MVSITASSSASKKIFILDSIQQVTPLKNSEPSFLKLVNIWNRAKQEILSQRTLSNETLISLGILPEDVSAKEAIKEMFNKIYPPQASKDESPILIEQWANGNGFFAFREKNQKKPFALFKVGRQRAHYEIFIRQLAYKLKLSEKFISGVFCALCGFPLISKDKKKEPIGEVLFNGKNQKIFLPHNKSEIEIFVGILEPFIDCKEEMPMSLSDWAFLTLPCLVFGLKDIKKDGIKNQVFIDIEQAFPSYDTILQPQAANTSLIMQKSFSCEQEENSYEKIEMKCYEDSETSSPALSHDRSDLSSPLSLLTSYCSYTNLDFLEEVDQSGQIKEQLDMDTVKKLYLLTQQWNAQEVIQYTKDQNKRYYEPRWEFLNQSKKVYVDEGNCRFQIEKIPNPRTFYDVFSLKANTRDPKEESLLNSQQIESFQKRLIQLPHYIQMKYNLQQSFSIMDLLQQNEPLVVEQYYYIKSSPGADRKLRGRSPFNFLGSYSPDIMLQDNTL